VNRSTFAYLANKLLKRDIVKSARISGTAASMLVAIALGTAVPASAQQLRDVTIASPSEAIASSSLRIANEMGLFEKHGIRAKFIRMENASVSTAAVVAGSVDFTIHGSSDLIAAQASGQKLVTVANLYGRFGNFLAISKAEADKRGLSSTSPLPDRIKALEGLLIAGTSATAAVLIAVRATAKAAGVEARYTYMSQ
jgi:ABC-type nitrate/sulfonate/bicarbonate transport system substrate-binding protein